jgi:long-chain acyl-CoA synthetase
VEHEPRREALVSGSIRLSYRDLEAAVKRVAAGLRAHGIGKGDRVALILGNRIEFVVLLFAAARIGAIAVPLNVREQMPGFHHCLGDSGASLVVVEEALLGRLPPPEELPAMRHRIALADPAQGLTYGGLEGNGDHTAVADVDEDETAAILYTSGTTGQPKGAMLTHLGLVHSVMHYQTCMGLSPRDRLLACVPLSHVTGLVALVATAVHVSATLFIMPAFRASEFVTLAERERITHTLLVPAMYKLCLLERTLDDHDLSSWRLGGYGGAPMAAAMIAELARRLPHLDLMNAYGATETTSPATLMPPAETAARPDSVGLPVPCGEILVMDEEGNEVARGQSGEIWIGGPMVVPGYWNNPDATEAEFAGGFWRSGDIGTMDDDGYLRLFDRKKDVINRGGYKIYSVQVENVLLAHAAVIEAAVVARPCPVLGERIHAFVVTSEEGLDADELRAFCGAHLADYMVPEGVILRTTPLPRNANGKLIKRELRDQLLQSVSPAQS